MINERNLNANTVKLIAIIAMLCDHIGWSFYQLNSVQGFILHIIGRTTIPIMCYFIVEGYCHTRSLKKYAERLFIFAVISHIPFYYFETGIMPLTLSGILKSLTHTSVIWSLLLGLISLVVVKNKELALWKKKIIILFLGIFSIVGDWLFLPIIWINIFASNRGNIKKQAELFMITSLPIVAAEPLFRLVNGYSGWYFGIFQIGLLLALPIIHFYNGKLGRYKNFKWLFYVFYPLHLLILSLIRYGNII